MLLLLFFINIVSSIAKLYTRPHRARQVRDATSINNQLDCTLIASMCLFMCLSVSVFFSSSYIFLHIYFVYMIHFVHHFNRHRHCRWQTGSQRENESREIWGIECVNVAKAYNLILYYECMYTTRHYCAIDILIMLCCCSGENCGRQRCDRTNQKRV